MKPRTTLIRAAEWLPRLFSNDNERHNVKRRVVCWFVIAIAVSFALPVGWYINLCRATADVQWVGHTQEIVNRLRGLSALLDSGSLGVPDATRGGGNQFLEHYRRSIPLIDAELGAIRQLTADNLPQQKRLTKLETLVSNRLDHVKQALDDARRLGIGALARLDSDHGDEMERIRQTVAEIEAVEQRLLVARSQAAKASQQWMLLSFLVETTANITIVVLIFVTVSREISRRSLTEKELRQSKKRFETIFEAATVGMALVDTDAKWLEVNSSLCEIVGYSKEELRASDARRIGCADDVADVLARARRVLGGEISTYEIDKRLIHKSGRKLWIALSISLIRDDAGRPLQFVIVMSDITAMKRSYREQQRYLGLVEATGSIVWNTLPSGEVDSEQAAWSVFSGQSFDQVKGSGWLDAIHPDDRSKTARIWLVALANNSTYEVEHRVRRHDGVYRLMLARAVPIRAGNGTIEEWVGVHSDIEDQKQAQMALLLAKEDAEAASQAKSQFLANVSHEIRTPMNAILGMTELTLDTALAPYQRDNLQIVRSAAESQLSVINDLLDFSKIEAGKLELDPAEFSLRDSLGDMLGMLRMRAVASGLELACRVDPEVPDRLIGDAVRLRQILVNLVGNAIKFTVRGQVVIDVNADPPAENKVALHVRVTDTGIGIPADKRVAIFAPFTQADGSTTRLYGGTGLGLAISSQLASLMGGKIWVESEVGQGSTFHFTVQFAISESAPATKDAFLSSLQGLRALVVGDQDNHGRMLEKTLTFWGLRTTLADNGQAALACLVQAYDAGTPFSLVLIDVVMAGTDGITLARRLNADPQLEGKVMLMLTSAERKDCAERLGSSGIATCLNKPIQTLELKAAILTALHTAPRICDPVASPPIRPLRILVAEDNPFNQRVAVLMLKKMGHEATIAVNGGAAVAALGAQSFDVVLMDLQMPEMDGFQATAAIRSTEAGTGRHISIIALTAHAMKEDRDRCLEAGMDGYVSKPIRQDKLGQEIERVRRAEAQFDGEPARLNGHIHLSTFGNDSGSLPCTI